MRIISMTATFGKLDGASIRLNEGLNVICAPNEWGKSTWCAFLTAMFYGIDTRERSSQDRIAEKEKYSPWSGKPMEGSVRMIFEGKDITIQRRTRGKVPMGEFLAYETLTGLVIPGLTGENCGKLLLGVERSVFTRTGFIRFSDLPVQQDEALRRRLNALVTTGDESGSAELLGRKLRELKNRCRYNRTGLIPEAQGKIRELESQLTQREILEKQADQLASRMEQVEEYLGQLEVHRGAFAYREAQEDHRRVEEATDASRAAQEKMEEMQRKCRDYPTRGELLGKMRQGRVLLEQLMAVKEERPASILPAVGLWTLCVLALVAAGALLSWQVLAVAAALALAAGLVTGNRRRREVQRKLEKANLERRRQELTQAVNCWQEQLQDLEELERCKASAQQAQVHLQTLQAMARQAQRPDAPDELKLTREETMAQIAHTEELRQRYALQLGQCQGKMEDLPDRQILEAQLEMAQRRLAHLEQTYRALDYGLKALEGAMQELQRRFAPRITRRAGEFLNILTCGSYDRISIGEDLEVQAARSEETALRSSRWRSDGTADQMYLALRLAVWEALNPQGPLVLDDALVRFDDVRLNHAMTLMKKLGKKRQILLFSCQEREKNLL